MEVPASRHHNRKGGQDPAATATAFANLTVQGSDNSNAPSSCPANARIRIQVSLHHFTLRWPT